MATASEAASESGLKVCTCNYASEHVHVTDLVRSSTQFYLTNIPGVKARMEETRQIREALDVISAGLEDEWYELAAIEKKAEEGK